MSVLLHQLNPPVLYLTLNRVEKHNAFDDKLLHALCEAIESAAQDPNIQLIVIQANGATFCAGADLNWMQRLAQKNDEDNYADARLFADTLHTLYSCPKPTLAIVQGSAFGGGVGLIAACDLSIAAESARFCFPEVKLGLIPAVISPYIIHAIGQRAAQWLFMTAATISATRAQELQLVQHTVADDLLTSTAHELIKNLISRPQATLTACKRLVQDLAQQPLDQALIKHTADLIAQFRASDPGKNGMQAFLNRKI